MMILGLLVITCGKSDFSFFLVNFVYSDLLVYFPLLYSVADAQCRSVIDCFGATLAGLNSFDDCCRPVLGDFSITRSFQDGDTCSPCYGDK